MARQKVTLHNDKIERTVRDIENTQGNIQDYLNARTTRQKELEEADVHYKELMHPAVGRFLNNKNVPESVKNAMKTTKLRLKNDITAQKQRSKSDVDFYNQQIPNYEKALAVLQRKYDKMAEDNPSTTFDIDDVRVLLSELKVVDTAATHFIQQRGIPMLIMYLEGIRCTPMTNPYGNLLDKDWLLPRMKIRMNLKTGMSKVTVDDPKARLPIAWSQGKPHPHIMGNDEPCYGDFLGAVVEAKDELDIQQMATIMLLFLETANPADDAGAHWPKFMIMAAEGNLSSEDVRRMRSHRSNGKHFYGRTFDKRLPNGYATWWKVPVVENGVVKVYELPYGGGQVGKLIAELKKPEDKRDFSEIVPALMKKKKKAAPRKKSMSPPPPAAPIPAPLVEQEAIDVPF